MRTKPTGTMIFSAHRKAAAATMTMLLCVAGLVGVAAAAEDQGLVALYGVVDAACDCAASQRTGMDAALVCTQGPREFGRLKVKHRDRWDDAARRRAEDLEKVIQSCLSNALSARMASERLGLPPFRADGSLPQVYWQRVDVSTLRADPLKFVRLRHRAGGVDSKISTGMVTAGGAQQLQLRRARRDGGGRETIALRDIEQAWVMILGQSP